MTDRAEVRAERPHQLDAQRLVHAPRGESEIVLDLSRLLSRVLHSTPTGVDRVEMAYARTLLKLAPDRVRFAAFHPLGPHGCLPKRPVEEFLELTAERWAHSGDKEGAARRWVRALAACLTLTPALPPKATIATSVHLNLSFRRLEQTRRIASQLQRRQALFVPFVHDFIPMDYPEYARPGGDRLHRRKLATVTQLASGAMANSVATAQALKAHFQAAGRDVPVRAAPLGADSFQTSTRSTDLQPYFVVLGTIEPRKNHLLLLNLWRRFAETRPIPTIPKLVIIGRRGWENENVLDLLDRAPALRGLVEERRRLPDHEVIGIMAGARALLMPSFAEGFGLPVVEALTLGVPVIASDLPALREAGDGVPEHLDPLDGPAWSRAILDYAAPASARRAEQLGRMTAWKPPTWEDHVRTALDLIDDICASGPRV